MTKKVDSAESRAVLLRTSADIASHCLSQIDVLAKSWPSEYTSLARSFRQSVEAMVAHAKEYGYIEKRGRV